MSLLLGLGLAALAADCEPVNEAEFRSLVVDAQSAMDRGDANLSTELVTGIEARIGCLTFAPSPRLWAELQVVRAVLAFSRGEDWQGPLAAALRIRPGIDRGVGRNHPMYSWEPPPVVEGTDPIPRNRTIYVDGRLVDELPPPEGLYLVQRTDGRFFNTLLVSDTPVPQSWAAAEVVQPPRIRTWARLSAIVTTTTYSQDRNWESSFYPEDWTFSGAVGGSGSGVLSFFSDYLGIWGAGQVTPLLGKASDADIRLGYGNTAVRNLTFGGGAGLLQVDLLQKVSESGDEEQGSVDGADLLFDPDELGGVQVVTDLRTYAWGGLEGYFDWKKRRFDTGFILGLGRGSARTETWIGLTFPPTTGSQSRWRVAFNIAGQLADFDVVGQRDLLIRTDRRRLQLEVGWVLGEYE